MPTIRFRPDQIAALSRLDCPARVIECAVRRWRKGEIVAGFSKSHHHGEKLLQPFSIWKRPRGLQDHQIRAILDAHFANPIDYSSKIAALDRDITASLSHLPRYQEDHHHE